MLHTAKPNETRCFRWEPESPESRAMWKTNIWISALPSNVPEQSGQDIEHFITSTQLLGCWNIQPLVSREMCLLSVLEENRKRLILHFYHKFMLRNVTTAIFGGFLLLCPNSVASGFVLLGWNSCSGMTWGYVISLKLQHAAGFLKSCGKQE